MSQGKLISSIINYLFGPVYALSGKVRDGLLVVLADVCGESGGLDEEIPGQNERDQRHET